MASRLPSARPGSPTSMAEARRLRVRPPRPCAPSRDLKCLAYVKRCVALCSRARRRANQKRGNHGVPAARGDLGTLGTGPGTRLRNPALKNTEGALRIKAARRERRPAPAHAYA